MTEEPEHRCFIGVPVTDHLLPPLRNLCRVVLQGERATSVPEANLHMTLVFLGHLAADEMRAAASVMEAVEVSPAPGLQPLDRVGGFPGTQSRIVAAQGEATPALVALVSTLRAALANAGLPSGDEMAFRPHITLGKRPRGGEALRDHACRLWLPVEEMVLFESVPVSEGHGVEYRSVARRRLA